ncbi:hypothetical protein RA280_19780 [Cupriavidus sp. CV2]|uniref:hypothetical protein n=1 Tax=Cupriavidus ulmosensis TaxID=3065913 RepID=UPI00296B0A07|nr:hypothetical protein [Cupriavidus sp. CV2]MDW3683944.1 hypothetical protein [Cupriavidus sp. CV2]
MSIRSLAARGLSFAHLNGLSAKAKAEDNEEKKDARAEDEEEEKEKAESEDDKKEDDKSTKAEEDEDEKEKAEEDDEKKGAKAEEDEDSDPDAEDDDGEMRGKSAVARARRREQARCAAIFASKAAARNPVLAANLAFKTRMTRAEAIATLEGTPAPATAAHVNRATRNPSLGADGGAKPSPQQALAARWDANLKAANPSSRR